VFCQELFPVTKSYLHSEMTRGTKKSGIKRIRVHDLRHSHASMLIEEGFSALLISERLGHESIETTLQTYSHLYPNKQIEVANRLDQMRQNPRKKRGQKTLSVSTLLVRFDLTKIQFSESLQRIRSLTHAVDFSKTAYSQMFRHCFRSQTHVITQSHRTIAKVLLFTRIIRNTT
jgi:hypothetical protein